MNTNIWIFQKVMPWIGVWFTVMTVIFLLVVICCIFKKKEFRYHMITPIAYEDFSIIVSFVPMVLVTFIALIIDGTSRIPSLIRKIGNKISDLNSITK